MEQSGWHIIPVRYAILLAEAITSRKAINLSARTVETSLRLIRSAKAVAVAIRFRFLPLIIHRRMMRFRFRIHI